MTKAIALLALCTMLGTGTLACADVGRTWTYGENGGGYFEQGQGNTWTEFVNNSGGFTFNFREIGRTNDYVLLYDASRTLWVRLHRDTSYIRHPSSNGWQFLYNGRWN